MQQRVKDPRIQSMFSTDRLWAFGAVLVLWATYFFVFWEVYQSAHNDNVIAALAVAGTLVLLFNSAAIVAMISHYSHDKDNIYGLDIRYLDAMKNKN
jgi:ABC-type polysaccharide/polyol phosphate export permease